MQIKKVLLPLLLLTGALSQAQAPYSADVFSPGYSPEKLKQINEEYHQHLLRRNPNWDQDRKAYEELSAMFIQSSKSSSVTGQPIVTIPIVFHIVYNTPQEYITDAQVYSQMVVLNEDFIRSAADTVNTPVPFKPLAGNPQIQFCLAQRDPQGNPTTGIERRQTTVASWGFNDAVKFYSQGGMDIWDPTRYFNVWVCNTGGTCWGEFPTGTVTNTHGAVMHFNLFGSQFTQYGTFPYISAYYDRGEIMCHEVGHCFNLRHIWGDDNSNCLGSDTCADTPDQAGPSAFCPSWPQFDACTPSGAGIMFQNFMDYSDDDCYNLFTIGQVARINAVLGMPPYNGLTTSNGCVPVVLFSYDAAVTDVDIPNGIVCATTFSPQITLRNWGSNALNSCVITYQIDANPVQTFNWFGNLPSLSSVQVTLNPVTVSTGMHTFTVYSSQPNGFTDGQPSNDQTVSNFTAFNGGMALPYTQGFESSTFVPTNWNLYNPDNATTWTRTTQAAKTGLASAKISNMYYNDIGQQDEMQLMPLNLSSIGNPVLSFQTAYTYYVFSNPPTLLDFTDTLSVLISTDCGVTWNSLYHKGGAQLSTALPDTNTNLEFIPLASEWRLETINLSAYASSTTALIKFRNTTGWGNRVYLDDINLFSTTGIEQLSANNISVFPNPFMDEINISGLGEKTELKVMNVLGEVLYSFSINTPNFTLRTSHFNNGIYFLEMINKMGKVVKRIVKQ